MGPFFHDNAKAMIALVLVAAVVGYLIFMMLQAAP